jgi:hypothetical protein
MPLSRAAPPRLNPIRARHCFLQRPRRLSSKILPAYRGKNMAAAPEVLAGNLAEPVPEDSRFYRLLEKALPYLKYYLPYNRFCDNLYHRLLFLKKHRRWPGNKKLWNDVWCRVKTSGEIRDPLRVFVSDKEHVKEYVRKTIGERYNVPTIAILYSPAEVETPRYRRARSFSSP